MSDSPRPLSTCLLLPWKLRGNVATSCFQLVCKVASKQTARQTKPISGHTSHMNYDMGLFWSHKTWALCFSQMWGHVWVGHATAQWSQAHEQTYNRMAAKTKDSRCCNSLVKVQKCCDGTLRGLCICNINELKQHCKDEWATILPHNGFRSANIARTISRLKTLPVRHKPALCGSRSGRTHYYPKRNGA